MTVQYLGTGRRKSSVARVRLVPGTGKVIINGREFEDYIPSAATRLDIMQPLTLTETTNQYDVLVNVQGGSINRSSWCNPFRNFTCFITS